MKRLLMFILILGLLASFAFGADKLSGDTRVDVVWDPVAETQVYAVDAGFVYAAGIFTIGGDAYLDTEEDLDMGIPISMTFGPLVLSGDFGVDNILTDDEIYVADGDVVFSAGVLSFAYGIGYGTDKIIDMTGTLTVTDLIPGVMFNVVWADADDIEADVLGTVEMGVTVSY